ncbi:MAG: hypothetical protein ACK5NT_05670 [Pyrinomonadaceae bacterium]
MLKIKQVVVSSFILEFVEVYMEIGRILLTTSLALVLLIGIFTKDFKSWDNVAYIIGLFGLLVGVILQKRMPKSSKLFMGVSLCFMVFALFLSFLE